jgi:hypothetical protein
MASIVFPLATNIRSLQRWGANDISKRIKQSLILYDKVIIETGTYDFQGANGFVLQGYEPWSQENSKEIILGKLNHAESKEYGYLKIIDGKTIGEGKMPVEKRRYRVEKKDWYIADFRTVDVIAEIESGSYGKIDFLGYLDIHREKAHLEKINNYTVRDLSDKDFAEAVRETHGRMPTVAFLNNINDSLAISHAMNMPVAVDSVYASILKLKTKCLIGFQFSVLERLARSLWLPDFGDLSLEKILELRKDKALTSFRNKISTLSSKLQLENNLNVEGLFNQEILKQIRELAPSKKRIIVNAFVGALSKVPCPFIGEVKTITDMGKQIKQYRDFSSNWLSFILKANELKGAS